MRRPSVYQEIATPHAFKGNTFFNKYQVVKGDSNSSGTVAGVNVTWRLLLSGNLGRLRRRKKQKKASF